MNKEKVLVTISGLDRVGIVAGISKTMSDLGVNIEDIKQTIMQNHFVMMMFCDISKSENSFKDIKTELIKTGEELGMEVWVQRKEIFDNMHTI